MEAKSHTIRDDNLYTVIVGWSEDLETFFAYVFERTAGGAEPVLAVGREAHEIPTISQLAGLVGRFADLDTAMISTLRTEAAPLV